ncbi:MAG TPA: 2-oxoglutarate ferredoxin oxidoreductase subunit alpha, partial [Anaerolineae bacterium]|nr:2-oxoglutarate ferredoxin oxidoreductase subunit alpha [Anaerolineae bacterium]
DPDDNIAMYEARKGKIALLAEAIPEQDVFGPESGDLLVVSWGSTYGAVRSAVEKAQKEGYSVAHAHVRYINPLPRNFEKLLGQYKEVIVPEINGGQLAFILRGLFAMDIHSFPKMAARPFKISEVTNKIEEILG